MSPFRNLSFRRKLFAIVGGTSFVTLCLACTALIGYDIHSFRSNLERDLHTLADVVGANSAAALAFSDSASATEYLTSLGLRRNIVSAALYLPSGKMLARFERAGAAGPVPGRPGPPGARMRDRDLELFESVLEKGEVLGTVYIRSDLEALRTRVREYGVIGLLVMLASALIGMVGSARLQRAVSDPVLALARAARRAALERDYSVRVNKRAEDELGALTDDFNAMLERIQERDKFLQEIQAELERQLVELQEQIAEREKAEAALRASEERLQQSQKMEAVGHLAGGIAHDFNNMLTVINGQCQLILMDLSADDPRHAGLAAIKEAGERAAGLTRQLLAFSRKQILAPRLLEVDSIVAGMSKMLRRLLGEHIELVFIPGGDVGRVRADPGQIEQVILNLAVNARDAMPDGGRVTLTIQRMVLGGNISGAGDLPPPGRYVVLAVADTGCGMDEATRARIFEPFFTTKGVGKGTGLGLSTVYGIVRQSGAHVTVDSSPGQGAVFRIYFPVADGEVPTVEETKPSPAVAGGTETILLVEDEPMVRQFARLTLTRAGYSVIEASYGSEAIQTCSRHEGPIHLLLTDLVMPQMNGHEVAQKVAESRPGIRALYMSGYVDLNLTQDGVFDPETNFIQKPFTAEALLRRVRQALDMPQAHVRGSHSRA